MIARLTLLSLALAAPVLAEGGVPLATPASPSAASATATPATAVSTTVATPDKPKGDAFPLHASAGITNSLGSGTFVISPNNPTLQSLVSLSGSAKLSDDWSLSVAQRFAWEWTNGDGDTYNHEIALFDPRVAVSFNALTVKDLGLGVALSGSYSLPISLASRQAGSLGPLGLSARASWSNEPSGFSAYATLGAGYTPLVPSLGARLTNVPGKPFVASNGETTATLLCTPRNDAELDSYGCLGGDPAATRWGAGVGGAYTFLEGKLTVALDLSYGQAFSVYVPNDGAADNLGYTNLSSGHAVSGIVPRQSSTGSLGLTWSPTPWFALTGGTYTAGPTLTSDGKGLRFPMWDFVSPYNNLSSFFIDTTFSI